MFTKINNIKFIKQRTATSCGPVAIFNALRWSGAQSRVKKELPELVKLGQLQRGGIFSEDFGKVLATVSPQFLRIKHFSRPSMKTMKKYEPKNDRSILLKYDIKKKDGYQGHWIFIPKTEKGRYICINDSSTSIATSLSKAGMTKYMKRKDGFWPEMYVLTRTLLQ